MNGITSRCISLDQGNKDPLQRVNYEFGLVLGVDEFVDEQCYFLEKEYQHNRSLHGYGTISGLLVSANENGSDIEIQVEKGMGVDQYGRVFVVRTPQCASLLSWIEDRELTPGDHSIYVVARYAECESALVPIAGQPCSTSEQSTAASRLQDIYEIELVQEPPAHIAHTAAVNLSEFLSRFRADPAAPNLSDLGTADRLINIIGPIPIRDAPADYQIRINQLVEDVTGTAGARVIPIRPQDVEELLNDIFTYWVTEVRPTLEPDLIDPDAPESADADPPPAEILLAQIRLHLPDNQPLALGDIIIDNSTRPYLLHTQLIQELYDIPDLASAATAAPDQPVQAWASIVDVSLRVMTLWIHFGEDLDLIPNENIQLFRVQEDGSLEALNIRMREDVDRRNRVGRYYRLLTGVNLENGDFLLLRFDTHRIRVGSGISLTDFIENAPFTYQNYLPDQGQIFSFHIVDRVDELDPDRLRDLILELMPPPEPVIPFVTITPITEDNVAFEYELWFHLDGFAEQNEGAIEELHKGNLTMLVETQPNVVEQIPLELGRLRDNVWQAFPIFDNQRSRSLVRFAFSLDTAIGINAHNPATNNMEFFETLGEYMDKTGQKLDGHLINAESLGGRALVVYVREQSSARRLPL